jgi:hypothetical protein
MSFPWRCGGIVTNSADSRVLIQVLEYIQMPLHVRHQTRTAILEYKLVAAYGHLRVLDNLASLSLNWGRGQDKFLPVNMLEDEPLQGVSTVL